MSNDDTNCYIYDEFYEQCHDEFIENNCCSWSIQIIICAIYLTFIAFCIMPLFICSLPLCALYYWIRYGRDGYNTKFYFPLKEQANSFKWKKNPNK